jgi:hypothetical protein
VQSKRKVHSIICHEGPEEEEEEEEERYSSTLSLISTLDGGGWPKSRPGRSLTGKTHGNHSIGERVGPRAGLDGLRKLRSHRNSIPGQPVASRHTDYAI